MEIRGYKRIKKKDIKRWFKGSNLILYVLILLLMFAFIAFAYKTIIGMNNDNADSEQNEQSETDEDINEATKEEATTYIAKNQSYKIRINVSKNIAVISSIDGSADSGSTVQLIVILKQVLLLYLKRQSGVSLIMEVMHTIVQDLRIPNICVQQLTLQSVLVI